MTDPKKPTPDEAAVALKARGLGCRPEWRDGIYGWAFHCMCFGNPHGVDQQCSMITGESLTKKQSEATHKNWEPSMNLLVLAVQNASDTYKCLASLCIPGVNERPVQNDAYLAIRDAACAR